MKIGDWGLSTLRPSTTAMQHGSLEQTVESYHAFRSLMWRAPELLRASMPPNGTAKGDIYSFAIVLQQVIQRSGPYERVDQDMGPIDVTGTVLVVIQALSSR